MTDRYITINQATSRINSHVIDGAGTVNDDKLKSLCIVRHPDAGGTLTNPLPSTYTDASASQSSVMERHPDEFDSHLVVSNETFAVLKSTLEAGERVRFKITDQSATFRCRRVLPLEEGDPVQRVTEALTRLDERVERIERDIDVIREVLQAETGARGSSVTKASASSNGPSSKRADYTSIDGKEQPLS